MRGHTYCDGHFVEAGPSSGLYWRLGSIDPPKKSTRPETAIDITKEQLDLWMWRTRRVWIKNTRAAMSVYASGATGDFDVNAHVIQTENEVTYTPSFETLSPVSYLAAYGKVRPTSKRMGENSSVASYTGNRTDGVTYVDYDDGSEMEPVEQTDVAGHVWNASVFKQLAAGRMLGDGIAGLDDDGFYWFDPTRPLFPTGAVIGGVSFQGAEVFANGFFIRGEWSLAPFPESGTSFSSGYITIPGEGEGEPSDPAHSYTRTLNKGQIGVISASNATGPFSHFPDIPVYGQITASLFVMGSLGPDAGYYPSISGGHVLTFNAELEADYRPYGGIYNETTGGRI